MAEWGRDRFGWSSGWSTRPPMYSIPPPHLGWVQNVPFWGKQFFAYDCPVTWGPLSYAEQFMSLYKKIQEWDDSAGLEAFQNAKFRDWAKINNRRCDIPLPDPDMYIDDVDYDAFIDPELVVDLHYFEPQQPAPVGSSVSYMNKSIRATERVDTQVPVPPSGLTAQHLSANSDVLLVGNAIKPTGWGVAENSYGWDVKGKSSNAWNSASRDWNGAYGSRWRTGDGRSDAFVKNSWQGNERDNAWTYGMHKTSGHHGNTNNETGGKYGWNKDGTGRFDLRETTSRFKTDRCYPSNSGWKNFRGKQTGINHNEKTNYSGRRTSLQWRPKSSVPGNNQAPNDSGATLQCEKSVPQ